MARNVHHIVHAAEQPEVAVRVHLRAVTCEIPPRIFRPILAFVTLRIAINGAKHRRPRSRERQTTSTSRADGLTLFVENFGLNSRKRLGCRSWLGHGKPRQG